MIEKLENFLNALESAFPVPHGVNNHCITLMSSDRFGYYGAPKKLCLQLFMPTGERRCFYIGENDFDRPIIDIISELQDHTSKSSVSV